MKRLYLFSLALLAWQGRAAADFATQGEARVQRMQQIEVKEALEQGLMALADLRIVDHPGKHSPIYDSCSTGDGCQSVFPVVDPRVTLGIPTPPFWPKIKNYPNEWASHIHALTQFVQTPNGQAPVLIPDANMFVTASTLYPLAFVKDTEQGALREMVDAALKSIRLYKRSDAYSFWRRHASQSPGIQVIGPLNIPAQLLTALAKLGPASSPGKTPENPHKTPDGKGPNIRDGFVEAMLDKSVNPVGVESFFNIPSDADDTALAMIAFHLFQADEAAATGEIDALAQRLLQHRDLDRSLEDGRDDWKGRNSGAFLTWLKDESVPMAQVFDPKSGTIPFGINNVDCVVNANAAFAMALAGYGQDKSVQDALTALNRAVDLEAWPSCGLYYPQKMMLPYTLTRAYRDGGLVHPGMKPTLKRLVARLIADQKETQLRDPKHKGAFSGGMDRTYDLATALALNALLNIGRDIPAEAGLLADYQYAIASGIQYLVKSKKLMKVQFPENLGDMYRPGASAAVWTPGIFFSASIQEAAQWRSEAYTVAIITEAFAKYRLAWDYGKGSVNDGEMPEKLSM